MCIWWLLLLLLLLLFFPSISLLVDCESNLQNEVLWTVLQFAHFGGFQCIWCREDSWNTLEKDIALFAGIACAVMPFYLDTQFNGG